MSKLLYVSNFLSQGLNRGYCEELADRLELAGSHVIRTSTRMQRFARLGDMLATTWRARRGYDLALVDLFSGPAFVWAEAICFELQALRKPFVVTLHGGNLPAFARKWPGRVRRLLRSANAVTAPSAYLRTELAPYRDGILGVRNGIDVATYSSTAARNGARLLWLRAFHQIYNPAQAVEVLGDLSRTDPDVTLTMIGPDKGDGSLAATKALARELNVEHCLNIVGAVPKAEVPEWLRTGDIFINTTNVDNTPISVLEAMAAGLPIVSTNVGGLPFLLEHERTALLVPPADVRAMTSSVRRVLHDARLRARLVEEGHKLVQAYDWSAVIPEWQRLVEGVALA